MTAEILIAIVEALTRAVSGDERATCIPLPTAGSEQTLVLSAPRSTGRLLGKGGETFRSLQRVVNASAWRTGRTFRLVIDDPRARPQKGIEKSEPHVSAIPTHG